MSGNPSAESPQSQPGARMKAAGGTPAASGLELGGLLGAEALLWPTAAMYCRHGVVPVAVAPGEERRVEGWRRRREREVVAVIYRSCS